LDATQALREAENALRDFIGDSLERALGAGWEEQCGVTEERLVKWRERRQVEEKRQQTGVTEVRLLYYADFYDLKTILKKHWSQHFAAALGEWKTMEVWLSELEKLRDPDAHRRELLPHQHSLALGISGEIRTRIARFRSAQDTGESAFPRIESVRDSLGTIWTRGNFIVKGTGKTVRPGETVDFVITASDPLDEDQLQYSVTVGTPLSSGPWVEGSWRETNSFSVTFEDAHVGLGRLVDFGVRSRRRFHAYNSYDDHLSFLYDVLPLQDDLVLQPRDVVPHDVLPHDLVLQPRDVVPRRLRSKHRWWEFWK
jgi:hypothetical protein